MPTRLASALALLLLLQHTVHAFVATPSTRRPATHNVRLATSSSSSSSSTTPANEAFEKKKEALKRTLRREYASFFAPMEKQMYRPDVQFVDPLTSLSGVDSYQKNVDMLGSRTLLGKLLFSDAGIVLHNIEDLGPRKLSTRWTLRLRAKALPWGPMARFTGVSLYDLDDEARVMKQTDYWDSINLVKGEYKQAPLLTGVKDFLNQLGPGAGGAQQAMNAELPFELLRRAPEYEVRRYPAFEAVETDYEARPEGYDRLGTYASGWNVENRKVRPFSPSIMRIDVNEKDKTMVWPVGFSNEALAQSGGAASQQAIPAPADEIIRRTSVPAQVVAVLRFETPATAPVVKYYSGRLMELLAADKLVPTQAATQAYTLCQYDAIFSIGTRRNEVWAVLEKHDWQE